MHMRWLLTLGILGGIGYGAWHLSGSRPNLMEKAEQVLQMGEFNTLEIKYSASQIMDSHRRELLKSNRHQFLEPQLKFYPYLLMDVKYVQSDQTQESVVLWDLCDGEMVLSTKSWEKTHGFGDCIKAGTDKHEFKVISILAKRGGSCDADTLSKSLHLDPDVIDGWVDSLKKKKLLVQSGNKYRLHMEDPLIKTIPSTHLDDRLVTQASKHTHKVARRFSAGQIEKIANAAFGIEFAIRHTKDVYLPVHCIVVQNPDGSIHTSLWNALNGRRVSYTHIID